MNASARPFVNARRAISAARLAACLGAAAGLAACGGNPFATAPVDPASPLAAEIAKGARAEHDYPSFEEIPAKPADVRPVQAFGEAAAETQGARADLERQTAPGTWTLQPGGTDPFATRAQSAVREDGSAGRSGAGTEDFSREAQERATPPPQPR